MSSQCYLNHLCEYDSYMDGQQELPWERPQQTYMNMQNSSEDNDHIVFSSIQNEIMSDEFEQKPQFNIQAEDEKFDQDTLLQFGTLSSSEYRQQQQFVLDQQQEPVQVQNFESQQQQNQQLSYDNQELFNSLQDLNFENNIYSQEQCDFILKNSEILPQINTIFTLNNTNNQSQNDKSLIQLGVKNGFQNIKSLFSHLLKPMISNKQQAGKKGEIKQGENKQIKQALFNLKQGIQRSQCMENIDQGYGKYDKISDEYMQNFATNILEDLRIFYMYQQEQKSGKKQQQESYIRQQQRDEGFSAKELQISYQFTKFVIEQVLILIAYPNKNFKQRQLQYLEIRKKQRENSIKMFNSIIQDQSEELLDQIVQNLIQEIEGGKLVKQGKKRKLKDFGRQIACFIGLDLIITLHPGMFKNISSEYLMKAKKYKRPCDIYRLRIQCYSKQ